MHTQILTARPQYPAYIDETYLQSSHSGMLQCCAATGDYVAAMRQALFPVIIITSPHHVREMNGARSSSTPAQKVMGAGILMPFLAYDR